MYKKVHLLENYFKQTSKTDNAILFIFITLAIVAFC